MHRMALFAAMMAGYKLSGTGSAQSSQARDCHVRVLRTFMDSMGNTWQKGKVLPANILRKDERGASFCAHGGSCAPRMMHGTHASQLIDCTAGESIGNGDFRRVLHVPSK